MNSDPIHALRLRTGFYDVPCNGCTACCYGDAVRILPHEDASQWQTEPHFLVPDQRMLAHREDGACVYVGEHGCTIQHAKPQQCYEMDCRRVAKAVRPALARKMIADGRMSAEVWNKGRELSGEPVMFHVKPKRLTRQP